MGLKGIFVNDDMPDGKSVAFRIAGIYLVVASLWIFFSDHLLARLAVNKDMLTQLAIYKGWFFVFVTALMLYLLIRRYVEAIRRRNRELLEARDAAEAATRAKSEFLANMSHEMRTPLTGVMGLIDLMLMENDTAEHNRYLEMARGSAETLNRLINDVLDYSMISTGKIALAIRPFDIRGCLKTVAASYVVIADKKGLEFRLEIDDDVPELVTSDEKRLRQVLDNLLGNALKFTVLGRITLTVRPDRAPAGPERMLLFTVQDTGLGIAAEFMERIFEVFAQEDTSTRKRFSGAGIGLALCREVIYQLGGNIWATSHEGEGSSFAFTIPLSCDIE